MTLQQREEGMSGGVTLGRSDKGLNVGIALALVLLVFGILELIAYYMAIGPFTASPRWGLLTGFLFIAVGAVLTIALSIVKVSRTR